MRAMIRTACLAACVGAVTLMSLAAPAQAAWRDRWGYWHPGPPPWAYGYGPPVVVGPPVVYEVPRVWVPGHWWGGVWIPAHWR
jgi:hypothetical protein